MKITTTAGTLQRGDKVGRRVVRYSAFRDYNLGYHVYFEGSETPEPYGRDEPVTVELANPGGWYIRSRMGKKEEFWWPVGSFWDTERHKPFEDEDVATKFLASEIERCPELEIVAEVVFLQ